MPTETFSSLLHLYIASKDWNGKKNTEKFCLLLKMIDWRYDERTQNNESHLESFPFSHNSQLTLLIN